MHIFKTDNSANEINMKQLMRAGNKEQSEILDNNTTMFDINPFFFSQQIHSPLACFNDHLHCTSFVSFPYMRWPFWLGSGRQIILFTYLFSILLLFFII